MYAPSISLPHLMTVTLSLALTAGISVGYTSSLRRRPEPTPPEAPPATMLTALCLALGAPALLLAQLSPPHLVIILAAAVAAILIYRVAAGPAQGTPADRRPLNFIPGVRDSTADARAISTLLSALLSSMALTLTTAFLWN